MPEWRDIFARNANGVALGFAATTILGLVTAFRHEASFSWLELLLGLRARRRREELEAIDAWAPEASEQLAEEGSPEVVQVVNESPEAEDTSLDPSLSIETLRVRVLKRGLLSESSIDEILDVFYGLPAERQNGQSFLDIVRQKVEASTQQAGEVATTAVVGESQLVPPPPQPQGTRERLMGLRTLLSSLQGCDRVCPESIMGPFQMNAGTDEEVPVVCFQFRMSHFTCKAYLAHGTQDEGSQHLKLQTTFEDNRRSLGEEQRYFIANEWNATKRYTRLKCGFGGAGRSSVFTLEYDVLVPADTPHTWGLLLLSQTLRMWYTSMVACVMHIVEPRDVPFATHEMITANTLSVAVREEDECLLQQSCPICFESFQVGETVRRLPCMHLFHVVGADAEQSQGQHCNIDRHLVRDKQCPVCKTPVDFMERIDKNSLSVKVTEGDSLVLPESSETSGPSGSRHSPEALSNATTEVTDAVTDTATTLAGLAQAAADAVAMTVPANIGSTSEGQARRALPAVPGNSQSVVAVARGAAVQGIQAAAEVAAAAARMAPNVQQEGNNGQTVGLPAQAAELERAVRSLQSRWMQIQDVVAGMQQMLQYIEESQSMMSAARTEQQAIETSNGEVVQISVESEPTPATGNASTDEAITVAPDQVVTVEIENAVQTQDTEAIPQQETEIVVPNPPSTLQEIRNPDPDPETVNVDVEEEAAPSQRQQEERTEVEEVSVAPSSEVAQTQQRRTEEAPAEVNDSRAQASRMAGLLQATLQAMRTPSMPTPPAPTPPPPASEAPSERARAPPPASNSDRWQPFTEAEKVSMAYMWRWRRANLMGSASSATAENSRSDNSEPQCPSAPAADTRSDRRAHRI